MAKYLKKKPKTAGLLQGFTAVAIVAAVLAVAVFVIASRNQPASLDLPETTPTTSPETETTSPIPSNPYGPEDFTYDGAYLTCLAGSTSLGVDVSAHQQEIDWEQVGESGMEFAMIRIGYRGTTSGGVYADDWAEANLQGAKAAGLKVGVYFFSQAVTAEEAAEEAEFCVSFLKDHEIDLPVVYDWEYTGDDTRTANMDEPTLMACIETFCQAVKDAGYDPMIYFNPHLEVSLLDLENLLEYPFWLAMYTDQMTYPHAVEMWQYTSSGTVPGIEGDVDINLWFNEIN